MGDLAQFPAQPCDGPACTACNGRGWVEVEGRRVAQCGCRAARTHARRLGFRGVPGRYQRCTRENWRGNWPEPSDLDLLAGKPWVVVILGPRGTGKTHFATALWDQILTQSGRHGYWFSVADAMRQVQSEFGLKDASGRELSPTRDRLYSNAVLLLDDLGFEKDSSYVRQFVSEVLHFRHMHELPTLITSNASCIEDFDALDPRITSRLQEQAAHVFLEGDDQRLV